MREKEEVVSLTLPRKDMFFFMVAALKYALPRHTMMVSFVLKTLVDNIHMLNLSERGILLGYIQESIDHDEKVGNHKMAITKCDWEDKKRAVRDIENALID